MVGLSSPGSPYLHTIQPIVKLLIDANLVLNRLAFLQQFRNFDILFLTQVLSFDTKHERVILLHLIVSARFFGKRVPVISAVRGHFAPVSAPTSTPTSRPLHPLRPLLAPRKQLEPLSAAARGSFLRKAALFVAGSHDATQIRLLITVFLQVILIGRTSGNRASFFGTTGVFSRRCEIAGL